jgi:hypothetical protein
LVDPTTTKKGADLEIEIAGLVGLVFASTAIGALICEQRKDVLNGAFIEGCVWLQTVGSSWNPLRVFVNRPRRNMNRLVSLASS